MPVSTRSQISGTPSDSGREPGGRAVPRNPHHGLKEKMKALTLFYDQHQKLMSKAQPETRVSASHHPSVELLDSNRKVKDERSREEPQEELITKPVIKKPIVLSRTDDKENQETNVSDHIQVYSCPKKSAIPALSTRKLSMGGVGPTSEGMAVKSKKMEVGPAIEDRESGSRIMVFVRLRPMSKKEKEAGARPCVRIVNQREVYLTGFASETDYLRLKRIQGRHFCFDASFPELAAQQEVYSTT